MPNQQSVTTDCSSKLCEVAGRDRAVAASLRAEGQRLLRLAEALETNSVIAHHAAAALLED